MHRIGVTTVLFIIVLGVLTSCAGSNAFNRIGREGQKYDVKILRDTWGVPHIFGVTDTDVAYGLAYAHAEDDFVTIQDSLLAARGKLASVHGPKAAFLITASIAV